MSARNHHTVVATLLATGLLVFAFLLVVRPVQAEYRQISVRSQRPATSTSRGMVESSTSVDSVSVRPASRTFLEPNVPNPFHGSTTISYSLAEETEVLLTVHDFFYNRVVTLVAEPQPAGRYSVTFSPPETASGVYFYSLKTDSGIEWGRMVHIQ